MAQATVAELISRSSSLGRNPRVTNSADGNTFAKRSEVGPVTGKSVASLWLKCSGGDL